MEEKCLGIWKYHSFFTSSPPKSHWVSLGEGETPLEYLFAFEGAKVFAKREDKNPTGSHKDRAFAYQVSHYLSQGFSKLVLSTSGNGGISLAAYCHRAGAEPVIFVHPETSPGKLWLLKQLKGTVVVTPKPINFSRYLSKIFSLPNLRPSQDDAALEGYFSLAYELWRDGRDADGLFLFTTSATTLVGLGRAWEKLRVPGIPLHAVQAGEVQSLAQEFWALPVPRGKKSLGVRNTPRKEEALYHIRRLGGCAWWVSEEEINKAKNFLLSQGILTSYEGAACLAAFWKALPHFSFQKVILLFSGHFYQNLSELSSPSFPVLSSYLEVREYFFQKWGGQKERQVV